jgi:hypothetical protein
MGLFVVHQPSGQSSSYQLTTKKVQAAIRILEFTSGCHVVVMAECDGRSELPLDKIHDSVE